MRALFVVFVDRSDRLPDLVLDPAKVNFSEPLSQ